MTCPLCQSQVPAGATMCPCCGAPCVSLAEALPGEERLEEYLPLGTPLLGGHYRLGRVVGHGGFGVTYQGADIPMQLPVAIKELFPTGCQRRGVTVQPARNVTAQAFGELRNRFLEEARILARIHHPGIVRVYTAFEENNTAYMVMEYLRGHTLEQLIEQRGPLKEDEVLVYVKKLTKALRTIHEHGDEGLLHRDIKPANIMITEDRRVVLIDFGSARRFAAKLSRVMSQVLTPGYAPLEQYAARGRFGPPTDIYALGATIYHALTGHPPPEAAERSQGVEVMPLCELVPSISRRTSDAVMAALEMSAAARPQSVQELVALFKGEAAKRRAGRVPTAPPSPMPEEPVPLSPRAQATCSPGLRFVKSNPWGFGEFVNKKDGTILVEIPQGSFLMGSDEHADESPVHRVRVPGFLISKVPVTNSQFQRFVKDTGYEGAPGWANCAVLWGEEVPAVNLDWADAQAYATWAGLRLPTEMEWEYAARGPESLVYPWGDEWEESRCRNEEGQAYPRPFSVGRLSAGASPFGCLDMAGNVWEWTDSWYDRYPGSRHEDESYGMHCRVLRGGSWADEHRSNFRGATRYADVPQYRGNDVGFRLALTM